MQGAALKACGEAHLRHRQLNWDGSWRQLGGQAGGGHQALSNHKVGNLKGCKGKQQ